MSLLAKFRRMIGIPSEEDRLDAHRGWRDAVHDTRNELTRANGASRRLQRSSAAATEALEADKRATSSLLDRLHRSGNDLRALTTQTLDRNRL